MDEEVVEFNCRGLESCLRFITSTGQFQSAYELTLNCPLCGQPVSRSLYEKITGILQERKTQLERIKSERLELRRKLKNERLELRKQAQNFTREKTRLIRNAVERRTKQLNNRMAALKAREVRLEKKTAERIDRITRSAHADAEREINVKMSRFRKELKETTKAEIKKERERTRSKVEGKYEKLRYSFNSALLQMKAKSGKIEEQQRQIRELERQLKRQTTPSVEGLLYETTLIAQLKKKFPEDSFLHTGKGGDVVHSVVQEGETVGIILYECKRVKNYSSGHVSQTFLAKEKRKADFGILVTNAMKKGTQGFYSEKGVLIVHPAGVLSLVAVLRVQMVRIAAMKLGQLERDQAVKLTLAYLQGPEFSNSMDSIVRETSLLYDELREEIKTHYVVWKKRYGSYTRMHLEASRVKETANAVLRGEKDYAELVEPSAYPQLPELQSTE